MLGRNFAFLVAIFALFLGAANVSSSLMGAPIVRANFLTPYDGKPIGISLEDQQLLELDKGNYVLMNEREGKNGRGIVIQDVEATPDTCIEKIMDLKNYPKMVPHVKAVETSDVQQFKNGSIQTQAKFKVGLFGLNFKYNLLLTHAPKHKTFSWTLDHTKSSDFEDSVGQWQVIEHPRKPGWSRVMYSAQVRLGSMIPDWIVRSLSTRALPESTTWLKREAEKEQRRINTEGSPNSSEAVHEDKKKVWPFSLGRMLT